MSARTAGRSAGALLLLAYVVYLAGGALAGAGSASTVVLSHVAAHRLQISCAVGIVFLLLRIPIAQEHSGTRGAATLPALAMWGLAGYAIFLAGAVLETLGYGVGVALSVPGGLFEITLGVLLIVKGFPESQSRDYEGLARNVPPAIAASSNAPTA